MTLVEVKERALSSIMTLRHLTELGLSNDAEAEGIIKECECVIRDCDQLIRSRNMDHTGLGTAPSLPTGMPPEAERRGS